MIKKYENGYILIVTLLMIAGMTAIGTYIYLRSTVFVPFMRTVYNREKAKMLALGGLQIAIRQLSQFDAPESEQTPNQPAKAKQEVGGPKELFMRLMPLINRWQSFPLKKQSDGIDGTINVCLVCEEGKINVNRVFDFDKNVFRGEGQLKGDWKKIITSIFQQIEANVGGKELFLAFESFLKNRGYPLYDVTELLTIKEFVVFRDHIFNHLADTKTDDKKRLYLTDLFTTFSNKSTIEPRFFSDSMLSILQLAAGQAKRSEQLEQLEKNFKRNAQWPTDWETQLKPLYEKEFPSLISGFDSVLSTEFNPIYFSVFSYGTVNGVTQRLLAIVKRNKRARNGETGYDIAIRKIYWL